MLTVALQHHEIDGLPRSDRFPGYPGDLNLSNTPANARFFDPQQRDLAYIRYQSLGLFEWSDALTFTASYHRQREIQTRGAPTTRHQETDVESVGLNLVSSRELAGYGKVTAGADWYHDDVDSSFGGSASGPIIPDDATYERIGAFVNWDTSITECLSGVVGVRYEHIDVAATPTVMGAPVHIEPSFGDWVAHGGLVYELTCDVNLVASISEGYRAPNLDELTANNPNVLQQGQDLPSLGLIPERSVNYEVGVKTNFENLRTQTFVFWTDLDNNIVPVSAGANQFRRANQDSYIQGVEFDGEWLFADDWSLYGNFWYTYGRNDVTGGALSRIPPTQGIVGVRWRASDQPSYCSLYTWIVRRQDRLDPVRDVGDERIPIGGTPGYATLNLRAGRAYGCDNQHRVSLSLENITDKNYLVHGSGVYGAGFTARLGYAWEY
jgi:outer membrane receptor protein involved in Fe transport